MGCLYLSRKYLKKLEEGDPIVDEVRVFKERGLDRYVLMKEAIEDLIVKKRRI